MDPKNVGKLAHKVLFMSHVSELIYKFIPGIRIYELENMYYWIKMNNLYVLQYMKLNINRISAIKYAFTFKNTGTFEGLKIIYNRVEGKHERQNIQNILAFIDVEHLEYFIENGYVPDKKKIKDAFHMTCYDNDIVMAKVILKQFSLKINLDAISVAYTNSPHVYNFLLTLKQCANCENSCFDACSQCNKIYYCSKKCQINNWKLHKKTCGKINDNKCNIHSLPCITKECITKLKNRYGQHNNKVINNKDDVVQYSTKDKELIFGDIIYYSIKEKKLIDKN
jgi:hypothetical protein